MNCSTSLIQIIANYDESTVMQTQRVCWRVKTPSRAAGQGGKQTGPACLQRLAAEALFSRLGRPALRLFH